MIKADYRLSAIVSVPPDRHPRKFLSGIQETKAKDWMPAQNHQGNDGVLVIVK
jgi:hypothetical protein